MPIPRPKPGPIVPANAKPGGRPTAPPPRKPATPPKDFTGVPWDDEDIGYKIIIYGGSGMGKSTLATMAPNPIFMPLDPGARNIRDLKTGKRMPKIPNVGTFEDVRAGLIAQIGSSYSTVVIDTVNKLESPLATTWTCAHVPNAKGARVANIEAYGFNAGYRHMFDTMSLPLLDLDRLTEAGKNVIVIAQPADNRVANAGGEDYLKNGLGLINRNPSIANLWFEWADHVFRIDYLNAQVKKESVIAKGKIVGDTKLAIYTTQKLHAAAKSRALNSGLFLEPVIAFESRTDDSVWRFMFPHLYE